MSNIMILFTYLGHTHLFQVLSGGQIVEFDRPAGLLADEDSEFHSMVSHTTVNDRDIEITKF